MSNYKVGDTIETNCGCIVEITRINNGKFNADIITACKNGSNREKVINWGLDSIVSYGIKEGDRVLVSDYKDFRDSKEKIYLFTNKYGNNVCVSEFEGYDGESTVCCVHVEVWKYSKPIPKKDKIEIKLVVNGKETDPTELSEESWNNIRRNC